MKKKIITILHDKYLLIFTFGTVKIEEICGIFYQSTELYVLSMSLIITL